MSNLPLILFTVTTNAIAQILLKSGMSTIGASGRQPAATLGYALGVLFQPLVVLGLITLVISMASHLVVLSKVDLSFAYPFLSIAYVIVTVYSWLVFSEDIGLLRLSGIALICLGTALIAQS